MIAVSMALASFHSETRTCLRREATLPDAFSFLFFRAAASAARAPPGTPQPANTAGGTANTGRAFLAPGNTGGGNPASANTDGGRFGPSNTAGGTPAPANTGRDNTPGQPWGLRVHTGGEGVSDTGGGTCNAIIGGAGAAFKTGGGGAVSAVSQAGGGRGDIVGEDRGVGGRANIEGGGSAKGGDNTEGEEPLDEAAVESLVDHYNAVVSSSSTMYLTFFVFFFVCIYVYIYIYK